jgi:hypothetical protein
MDVADLRLDRLIELADETGMTLDELVKLVGRADQSTFLAFSESASMRPRYMKSNDRP